MSVELKMVPWEPGQILRIETPRFFLRSLTADDATPVYIGWWNDAEVQAGLNFAPRGWGRREAVEHISGFNNQNRFHLGIFDKQEDCMIGFFALFLDFRRRVATSNVIIGDKRFWGQRVVQEVRGEMLKFIFGVAGMEKVKGEIKGRNLPSIFNYKSMGFVCEGILRSETVAYNGGRADIFLFGLLREEWERQISGAAQDGR